MSADMRVGPQGPAGPPGPMHTSTDVQSVVDGQALEWNAGLGLFVPKAYLPKTDLAVTPRYLSDSARSPWMANGAIAETFPRYMISSNNLTMTSGRLWGAGGIVIPGGRAVNSISVFGAAAATAPTHRWFCLFDRSGNVLAKTVDDLTNVWNTNTVRTLALSATYTPTNSIEVYVGFCEVATTPTTLWRPFSSTGAQVGAGGGMGDSSTSGLTTPASCPATVSVPGGQNPFYAYIS